MLTNEGGQYNLYVHVYFALTVTSRICNGTLIDMHEVELASYFIVHSSYVCTCSIKLSFFLVHVVSLFNVIDGGRTRYV